MPRGSLKVCHVGFDQLGVEAAANVLDEALFDGVDHRLAHIDIERQKHVARCKRRSGRRRRRRRPGEHEGGRPVVPATRLIGATIFADRRIDAELVDHVRAMLAGDAHASWPCSDSRRQSRRARAIALVGISRPRSGAGSTAVSIRVPAAWIAICSGLNSRKIQIDDHVGLLQGVDRLRIGGQAGLADRPCTGRSAAVPANACDTSGRQVAGRRPGRRRRSRGARRPAMRTMTFSPS